jgi:CheY-like chemotaxis protein
MGSHSASDANRDVALDLCVTKPVRQLRLFEALADVFRPAEQSAKGTGALDETGAPAVVRFPGYSDARILLAEDNAVNRRVALGQLRMLGCTAKGVTNGHQVLEAIERAPYDIILMDCQMPEMDGYEATRTIRAWEGDASRPRCWQGSMHIIAMTANAMVGDREKCLEAGMNNYVTKPVLLAGLRAALEQWRPKGENETSTPKIAVA